MTTLLSVLSEAWISGGVVMHTMRYRPRIHDRILARFPLRNTALVKDLSFLPSPRKVSGTSPTTELVPVQFGTLIPMIEIDMNKPLVLKWLCLSFFW
jgi:hypothetical protein